MGQAESKRRRRPLLHLTPPPRTTRPPTRSSDEFNLSEDDDAQSGKVAAEEKARSGRAFWLAFKKLARPVRSVHITTTSSSTQDVPPGRHTQASCQALVTLNRHLVSDVHRKAPETFNAQLEGTGLSLSKQLFMAVSFWLKLVFDLSGMWIPLSLIRKVLPPPGHYWTVINHVLDKLSNAIPQFPVATKKKKDRHPPGKSLEAGTMLGAGATSSAQASLVSFHPSSFLHPG
ncbi:hypothetical protein FRC04_006738 [Tulasnella sp. 424]|nr:hypothetical protein FRC04_006738 [Tulasnella sp. 424]